LLNTNLKPGLAGWPVEDFYLEAIASVVVLRSIGK
jgi:hypothetical protein